MEDEMASMVKLVQKAFFGKRLSQSLGNLVAIN